MRINLYDVVCSDEYNMSIDTDVLDCVVDDIDDILDDIEVIQLLRKHGIIFRVQYVIDEGYWRDCKRLW